LRILISRTVTLYGETLSVHTSNHYSQFKKKLIRIVTNSHYMEHTAPLFKSTNILPVDKLHLYLLALHKFKKIVNNNDHYSAFHNYNTRSCYDVHIPFHRLTVTQHSVPFACAHAWNDLPLYLKNCQNIHQFKKLLKIHLISTI